MRRVEKKLFTLLLLLPMAIKMFPNVIKHFLTSDDDDELFFYWNVKHKMGSMSYFEYSFGNDIFAISANTIFFSSLFHECKESRMVEYVIKILHSIQMV